jgi:hypothetical protein
MLPVSKPGTPPWAWLGPWMGLTVLLLVHLTAPCLPPSVTVALFVSLALHC